MAGHNQHEVEIGNDRLDGWKEISGYLKRSIRTAQRWEQTLGLPIHRLRTEKSEIVFAYISELEAWRLSGRGASEDAVGSSDGTVAAPSSAAETVSQPSPAAVPGGEERSLRFGRRAFLAAMAAALLMLAAVYLLLPARSPNPASYRVSGSTLTVFAADGKELWSHDFPKPLDANTYQSAANHHVWIGSLDGSGHVVLLFDRLLEGEQSSALIGFSATGRELWTYHPGGDVQTTTERFDNSYSIVDMTVLQTADGPRIAVAANQSPFYPSQVSILRPDGRVQAEYWHSGHLDHIYAGDHDRQGHDKAYAIGVDNEYKTATLVVLDPATMHGRAVSSQTDARYQLLDMPKAQEAARLWFPRSCVNRARQVMNFATTLQFQQHGLTVYVCEDWGRAPCTGTGDAELIYSLTADLKLHSTEPMPNYVPHHQELERTHALAHTYSDGELQGMSLGRPKSEGPTLAAHR